jgi:flagellar hook assembly protein FlgD
MNGGPTTGPNLDLATDGFLYVDVDLTPIGGGAAVQAILRMTVSNLASVGGQNGALAVGAILLPSRPNPFSSGTTVSYVLRDSAPVRLSVYDVLGRHVRTLADGMEGPGVHMQAWDGAGSDGSPMPAGAYFIRLESNGVSVPQKVIRIE